WGILALSRIQRAPVPQRSEGGDLKSPQCGFESHRGHRADLCRFVSKGLKSLTVDRERHVESAPQLFGRSRRRRIPAKAVLQHEVIHSIVGNIAAEVGWALPGT